MVDIFAVVLEGVAPARVEAFAQCTARRERASGHAQVGAEQGSGAGHGCLRDVGFTVRNLFADGYLFGIWLQMGIWPVAKTFDAVTHETLML